MSGDARAAPQVSKIKNVPRHPTQMRDVIITSRSLTLRELERPGGRAEISRPAKDLTSKFSEQMAALKRRQR